MSAEPVLRLDDVSASFVRGRSLRDVLARRPGRRVQALDRVSLELARGEILAVVGESGAGKTTIVNVALGLLSPDEGRVSLGGQDIAVLSRRAVRRERRRIQLVPQDPYESLNPRMTVGEIVGEPLRVHGAARGEERSRRVVAALEWAGLRPPERFLALRPVELSGGQRQRVAVAAALVLEPQVVVADEPVSMLDVSIRAEILNLLASLAHEQGMGVVMVTHDLATVAAYADRIAVLYLGRVVETGPTLRVLRHPSHPYTRALLSVVPAARPDRRRSRIVLEGETPDPAQVPSGCRFHPRCPEAFERCPREEPGLVMVDADHAAACWLADPLT